VRIHRLASGWPQAVDGNGRFETAISWAIVAFCGAVQAIAHRFYVNPDGVSYLNMSDAYTRGDWAGAVNTYWSPLYPWLIGVARRVYAWPAYWESSVVHGINFAIYLASYACFRFMLRELTRYQRERKKTEPDVYVIEWSHGWEFIFAHALFLWSALILIGVSIVTPDMMIAAEVYLLVGLMLRILHGGIGFSYPILIGGLLGLSYLTKAVMFPIGMLAIVCTGWGRASGRWTYVHRIVCILSFLIVATPQVIAMSRAVGRPSFGENGKIAYALYVNAYSGYWAGTPPGSGRPLHPVRQLLSNPPVYEFATSDSSSSYPFWDKPGYWLEGIRPHFNLAQQVLATQRELSAYASGFATLLPGAIILLLMGLPEKRANFLGICILAVGVLALYALVHIEWRLVAPWAVVLFLACASSVAFRDDFSARVGARAVLGGLSLWYLLITGNAVRRAAVATALALAGKGAPHQYWTVASAVQSLGVKKGQRVASIGRSSESYWARLAGVQIALEIPVYLSERYWTLDAADRNKVHQVFIEHGAKVIVASNPPAGGGGGWIRLGESAFYGFPLTPRPGVTNRP